MTEDIKLYVPVKYRVNRSNSAMDAEEVISGLQSIRIPLSRQEQEYIDYACKCVEKVERVYAFINGVK